MRIQNSVAFITGANRGLGFAFAKALLDGGARKVYAAARDPATIAFPGLIPVRLDLTHPQEIEAAAHACGDVDLLINNAGVSKDSALLADGAIEAAKAEMETNFFGPLLVSRAFAPVLARNGGGAILNVLSALSWISFPAFATYSASKSAAWSLTNGLRNELREQGTQVVGLHVGFMETEMAAGVNAPKSRPEDVAKFALSGVEAGEEELLADEVSRSLKQGLSAPRGVYLGAPAR
jgi:NAD(P)-dependent dehydrogenase (short-subunit alcohol dehydrogenase family)